VSLHIPFKLTQYREGSEIKVYEGAFLEPLPSFISRELHNLISLIYIEAQKTHFFQKSLHENMEF